MDCLLIKNEKHLSRIANGLKAYYGSEGQTFREMVATVKVLPRRKMIELNALLQMILRLENGEDVNKRKFNRLVRKLGREIGYGGFYHYGRFVVYALAYLGLKALLLRIADADDMGTQMAIDLVWLGLVTTVMSVWFYMSPMTTHYRPVKPSKTRSRAPSDPADLDSIMPPQVAINTSNGAMATLGTMELAGWQKTK